MKTVLYLGQNKFPSGLAATQRQLQISKAIKEGGNRVLVINRKGTHSAEKIEKEKIKTTGSLEGIDYIYTSGTPLYPSNFVVRNLLKIIGVFGEFFTILFYRLTQNASCAIVSSSKLFRLKYYWFVSRILNIKLIFDYVEYSYALSNRSIKTDEHKKGFDTVFVNYADAFIVISSFLEQHVKALTSKPYLIIPPTIDFEKYNGISLKPEDSNYFLYCSTTFYMDVIEFIIKAYKMSGSSEKGVSLVLVINGNKQKIETLRKSTTQAGKIKIISDLPYNQLIGYYKNARGLLIPLQNNLQDKARFPFKISEYTASARPIITSDIGAIKDYFQDGVSAFIATPEDIINFSSKMTLLIENPTLSEQIAQNSYQLGSLHFNYRSYSKKLSEFIFSL